MKRQRILNVDKIQTGTLHHTKICSVTKKVPKSILNYRRNGSGITEHLTTFL